MTSRSRRHPHVPARSGRPRPRASRAPTGPRPHAPDGTAASTPRPERPRRRPSRRRPCSPDVEPPAEPVVADRRSPRTSSSQFYAEPPRRRRSATAARGPHEIDRTGSYTHTLDELTFGARVAWRNAARCIGRLYWNSLRVRDLRHVTHPADVAARVRRAPARRHPRRADPLDDHGVRPGPARAGPARASTTTSSSATPGTAPATASVRGDGRNADVHRPGGRARLAAPEPARPVRRAAAAGLRRRRPAASCSTCPPDAVLEVPLSHPEHEWFAELRLRWHAVPAISNMPLVVGGVTYPAAPFNGWYLGTEIGARNLADADRYDLLPVVAAAARAGHALGAHAVARPGAGRDGAGGAALVRRRRRHDGRPPHRVRAVPHPRGPGGARPGAAARRTGAGSCRRCPAG